VGWHDSQWLFPKAVLLLDIMQYRKSVLTGFVLSIGSRTDTTVRIFCLLSFASFISRQQRPAASSMVGYAQSLPISDPQAAYDLLGLVDDLIGYAESHFTSNSVVLPVLQTLNILLSEDALARFSHNAEGLGRFVCSLECARPLSILCAGSIHCSLWYPRVSHVSRTYNEFLSL
jgi:hypothetical protein